MNSQKHCFTQTDMWSGGFYELLIELPASQSVGQFLSFLWQQPQLSGCYHHRQVEPEQQPLFDAITIPTEGHLYGIATFDDGLSCACGTYTTFFDHEQTWWIGLYLPLGALSIYPIGGYPFETTPQLATVLQNLNAWLYQIAQNLYEHSAFNIAVIGFDPDISQTKKIIEQEIPTERWDGILISNNTQLLWYPPTIFDKQYTISHT
ncbi:MAG: hypothetical protein KAX40_08245 [Herpetosiphon sp.]|nr:hypothetical protein [Herpetosiphon sp.]